MLACSKFKRNSIASFVRQFFGLLRVYKYLSCGLQGFYIKKYLAIFIPPIPKAGPALGRFDRLLQIGPRAERGPAFFFKRRQSRSSRSSGGIADAITCVHSASQRPAVKPVVTRLINDVF